MMSTLMPTHLQPSELGNKSYWDAFYKADLSPKHAGDENDSAPSSSVDPLDETSELSGWFADVNATKKIVKYLSSTLPNDTAAKSCGNQASILDLGTGNGELLFTIRQSVHFKGPMLGVDYSAQSIELCQRLSTKQGYDDIHFIQWDVMHDASSKLDVAFDDGRDTSNFDIVLDKGTFDAISLSDELNERGQRLCEGYRERVENLVNPDGGLLVITSCNWTEHELRHWIERGPQDPAAGGLVMIDKIEYPTFRFGGQIGQSVCTLCFRRQPGS